MHARTKRKFVCFPSSWLDAGAKLVFVRWSGVLLPAIAEVNEVYNVTVLEKGTKKVASEIN